ncbi:basic salivary proline-rich protein 3-like [Elephas maximus indicus]|uniref:basic salivary proline-rich protein 3-like n=1 Tax=Elephas maximus indicus TaxID=99487 RepID=UPI002115FD4E|nr:basic salivary proline-rich protein 3-like [Elephas maximus indicus]
MTIMSEIPAGRVAYVCWLCGDCPRGSGPLESWSDPPLPAPRPASRLPCWDGALSTPKSVTASWGLLVPPAALPCRPLEPVGPPPRVSSGGWSSSPCLCRDRVSRLGRCSPRSNTSRCLPGTSPTGCVPRRPPEPAGPPPGVSSGGWSSSPCLCRTCVQSKSRRDGSPAGTLLSPFQDLSLPPGDFSYRLRPTPPAEPAGPPPGVSSGGWSSSLCLCRT